VEFLPDFNVKNGYRIYPAADLSEQTSTAGKKRRAQATRSCDERCNNNRHFGRSQHRDSRCGGTRESFPVRHDAEEVVAFKAEGYTPRSIYESNPKLREALDLISSGSVSDGDRRLFHPLVDALLTRDEYMLLADYEAYVERQHRVLQAYSDQSVWTRMSILNSARVGRFSSDRSIREYCRDIWKVTPIVFEERRAGCGP
jgi:glycogen phosphorylase